MASSIDHPNVQAALARSGQHPPPSDVAELVELACSHAELDPGEILEITRGGWGNEEQSAENVLVVQTRDAIFVIIKAERRFRKPGGTARIRFRYEWYTDLGEDDELAGPGVMFLAKGGHKDFLLTFPTTDERDRMFRCLFEAHRGQFSRWSSLQLDPADYMADFDRHYAELVLDGPSVSGELTSWVSERYGDFDLANALGLAMSWRQAELRDKEQTDRNSARVAMMAGGDTLWRTERHPESRRVYVRLAEQMYDDGLLGQPFDQRSYTDEPLGPHDVGPQRLHALMTLAAFARAGYDPRAEEWIAAAQAGIPTVPPTVLTPALRELWAAIGALPSEEAASAAEIPIWEDADVSTLTTGDSEESIGPYSLDRLSRADKPLVLAFFEALGPTQVQGATQDGESLTRACLYGVSAVEGFSALAPPGWRKLILYIVSDLTYALWYTRQSSEAAGRLAQWVIVTIEKQGWGPDGRSTPLGQHHSYAMGVAAQSGFGMVELDETTGQYHAPTGDEARRAATAGHF